ncbi:hypothetical protein [Dipodfec virus UOA04_Rod_1030]|nr:hypothetical protein [Dipodfec virus UOA04_Rod_1030]
MLPIRLLSSRVRIPRAPRLRSGERGIRRVRMAAHGSAPSLLPQRGGRRQGSPGVGLPARPAGTSVTPQKRGGRPPVSPRHPPRRRKAWKNPFFGSLDS